MKRKSGEIRGKYVGEVTENEGKVSEGSRKNEGRSNGINKWK